MDEIEYYSTKLERGLVASVRGILDANAYVFRGEMPSFKY